MKKWLKYGLIVLGLILIYIIFFTNFIPKLIDRDAIPGNLSGENNESDLTWAFENKTIIGVGGGACVIEEDYMKICTLTLRENCPYEIESLEEIAFYEGLLCSAEELETVCGPTTAKATIEDKDYFVDSCGNQANPYDISKKEDLEYWTNLIVE